MKHDIRTRSARLASWLSKHGWLLITWTLFIGLFVSVCAIGLERCHRREECEGRGGVMVQRDGRLFGVCVDRGSLR